jgi:phage baseplate assembly protein W
MFVTHNGFTYRLELSETVSHELRSLCDMLRSPRGERIARQAYGAVAVRF